MEIEKDESSEMQFSKSGHMKHIKFLSMLEEMKYKIPAEYLGEWNEERGVLGRTFTGSDRSTKTEEEKEKNE